MSSARSHLGSDFTGQVQPGRPFKWDQDSWRWRPLPFTLTSLPPASSLTSCCHASAMHISLRIQQGVSGSRLGLSINKSKQIGSGEVGVDTELAVAQQQACVLFVLQPWMSKAEKILNEISKWLINKHVFMKNPLSTDSSNWEETHLGEMHHKQKEETPERPHNHRQEHPSVESWVIPQQGFRSNTHFKRLLHLKERPELSELSKLV